MTRFRSVPNTIDAVQWSVFNEDKIRAFVLHHVDGLEMTSVAESISVDTQLGTLNIWCHKGQSTVTLHENDWLIAEADRSGVYPCEAGVFALRYRQLVGDEDGPVHDDDIVDGPRGTDDDIVGGPV
jgi:hypothetical protein